MLQIVGASWWLVSATRWMYLLPARLDLGGQLCLPALCPSITSFPFQSNILLSFKIKNFVSIIFFRSLGACQRLELKELLHCQSGYSSKCVWLLFPSVQESGRRKVTSAEVSVLLCRSAAAVLAATVPPLRQGHFLPQKPKHAKACTQQMGFGKELGAVLGSALGQSCGGSAQELEVQSVSYHTGSVAKAALS